MLYLCDTSRLNYLEETSTTKIDFQNPYATLYLDTHNHTGHLEWSGIVPSDYYRKTLLQALEVTHQYGVLFWIQDMRKLRKLSPLDTDWMIHEFMPLLSLSPLKKIALLESEDNIASLFLRDMVYTSYSQIPFRFRFVDSIDCAISWFNRTEVKQSLLASTIFAETQLFSSF